MPTNSNALSKEEKINLLILAMKLDGLNPELVADGVLGQEAIKAAKVYAEHIYDW